MQKNEAQKGMAELDFGLSSFRGRGGGVYTLCRAEVTGDGWTEVCSSVTSSSKLRWRPALIPYSTGCADPSFDVYCYLSLSDDHFQSSLWTLETQEPWFP